MRISMFNDHLRGGFFTKKTQLFPLVGQKGTPGF